MTYTLLLRLKAPMQSWGVSSRFSIRDTGKEPSKSGVIGLLCAALGISREEANLDNPQFASLTKLKMNVCVLREGVMQKDYHTAQNVAKAAGGTKPTELSDRWYLADADFLVGLESEHVEFLESLQDALKKPKWQLFLGRKAFVPSLPVYLEKDGIQEGEPLEILRNAIVENTKDQHRIIVEDESGTEIRQDVPLDFAKRRFSLRRVRTEFFAPVESLRGDEIDEEDLSNKNGS